MRIHMQRESRFRPGTAGPASAWPGGRLFLGLLPALLAMSFAFGFEKELPLRFEHYSLEEGLSQSIVDSIAQDTQGFLWLATEDGLNRFDGYNFDVFRYTPGTASGLSFNHITSIVADSQGVLWIGTFSGGLNRYDTKTGIFKVYRNEPRNPASLCHDTVRTLCLDRYGKIWVGTVGGGVCVLDPTRGTFTRFPVGPGDPRALSHGNVSAIVEDRQGAIWIATRGGGLNRYDPATRSFACFRNQPDRPDSIASNDITALCADRSGRLWVGTAGSGLDRFEPASGSFRHYRHGNLTPCSISSDAVTSLLEDRDGRFWVGTSGGGLNHFLVDQGIFLAFRHDPQDRGSLASDDIRSLYEDAGGVLWVGTYGSGLCKCTPGNRTFQLYKVEPGKKDGLGNDIVWALYEDPTDGTLWIGSHGGGLQHYDPARGTWTSYLNRPGDPASLSGNRVRTITPDPEGGIWVGTDGNGLNYFDPRTGKSRVYRFDPQNPGSLRGNFIRAVYRDRQGHVWVGTQESGLERLDPRTGQFVHFRHDPADPGSLSKDMLRTIFEDRAGRLWIGTNGGGLELLDRATGKFTHFRSQPGKSNTLSSDCIFTIYEDSAGYLWLGTWGGGLNRFDPRNGSVTIYTIADGLPSNSIYGILGDGEGKLWMSTNNGLSCFDPVRKTFRNFSESDGLQSNEFNGGSFFRGHSGALYFGGIKGFNSFYPNKIYQNPHVPAIVITNFLKLGVPVRTPRPISWMKQLDVWPGDYNISLEFSGLDFADPAKNRYAFHMEGLDPGWIQVDSRRRSASYTNLEPGRYTFQVRSCNNDGLWNDTGASVEIVVHPPYYRTWWFRGIVAFALCGIIALVGMEWFSRHREKMRLKAIEQELDVAATIQKSMLPDGTPTFLGRGDIELCAEMVPARHVGGDFYDYYMVEPDIFAFAIGDVSGKGVPAAMQMSMSRVLIKGAAVSGRDAADLARVVNDTLLGEFSGESFVTVFFGILDLRTGVLEYVRAGHNPPALVDPSGEIRFLEEPGNLFIGMFADAQFEAGNVVLEPGTTLFLFTDGITEAQDTEGRLFDDGTSGRLERALSAAAHASLPEMVLQVLCTVRAFSAGAVQSDDRTVLAIRYKPDSGKA